MTKIHKNPITNVLELYPVRYHNTHETTIRQLKNTKGWADVPGGTRRLTHKDLIDLVPRHGVTDASLTVPDNKAGEAPRLPDYPLTELVPAKELAAARKKREVTFGNAAKLDIYTDAPGDYDYGGTIVLGNHVGTRIGGGLHNGHHVRRVRCKDLFTFQSQTARYASGLYLVADRKEFEAQIEAGYISVRKDGRAR